MQGLTWRREDKRLGSCLSLLSHFPSVLGLTLEGQACTGFCTAWLHAIWELWSPASHGLWRHSHSRAAPRNHRTELHVHARDQTERPVRPSPLAHMQPLVPPGSWVPEGPCHLLSTLYQPALFQVNASFQKQPSDPLKQGSIGTGMGLPFSLVAENKRDPLHILLNQGEQDPQVGEVEPRVQCPS